MLMYSRYFALGWFGVCYLVNTDACVVALTVCSMEFWCFAFCIVLLCTWAWLLVVDW